MRMWRLAGGALVSGVVIAVAAAAGAADFPKPKTSEYVIKDFAFHTGEVMPEMKVSYTTVGDASGEPVLMLHGTTDSAEGMLTEGFAGALYGPSQALDATKYFIIIPDAIGTGGSSKPSDGLRAAFPEYNYDDMVAAQYDLVKNHLGIDHLRLVMGNSMGGMLTWVWGVTHPEFMDALVPMASLPGPMSGRNWMMRRMLIDAVRTDPAWDGGNYKEQPPISRSPTSGSRSPPATARSGWRRSAIRAKRRMPTSTSSSPRPRHRTPTTRCTSGTRPATSIRPPTSAGSRRPCW
jgi:homoserine O-acetyltransferase